MTLSVNVKRTVVAVTLMAGLLLPTYAALAQAPNLIYAPAPTTCPVFYNNLYLGLQNADVTNLQAFLSTQGYFPYSPIGIFGPLTFRAVQNFQAAHGLPRTGYVGVMTRGVFGQIGCTTTTYPPYPYPQPQPVPPVQQVSVQTMSPQSGPIGTVVTLYGSGLYGTNTVYFGGKALDAVYSNNGTTLTFTVPQYISPNCPPGAYCAMSSEVSALWVRPTTPGAYQVYVQNQNGTSNTVNFYVTDQSAQNQTPVISGIDAPPQLIVGQTGTWTVRATLQNYVNGANLHYQSVWGDETTYAYAAVANGQPIQTSATFTHMYVTAGTYHPTFTVSNDTGQQATISATVVVH
ncbi:MAG: peptidoglycan-binding protein [Candidatus Adlerbacteria bacterium]|nr:peptidoglycan-binding protein [Candidatus Adlerbacteria bacterium]